MNKSLRAIKVIFTIEDLKLFDDVVSLDNNYCTCYCIDEIHPDFALCGKCELVIPGTDESIIKTLVSIKGNYNLLKSQ
ncbi:hypothetical protein [Maribacter sp. R86514]|uniref:hypothetical protein n=1 Tax=Maribacter sp. R86514 TaxID=3093854 RepID=UPI0037C6E15E